MDFQPATLVYQRVSIIEVTSLFSRLLRCSAEIHHKKQCQIRDEKTCWEVIRFFSTAGCQIEEFLYLQKNNTGVSYGFGILVLRVHECFKNQLLGVCLIRVFEMSIQKVTPIFRKKSGCISSRQNPKNLTGRFLNF